MARYSREILVLTPDIRAVFFDAVGTLIVPDPPVAEIYAEAGRRHGIELSLAEISTRFRAAFRAEEKEDAIRGGPTSEERERIRWQRIVGKVFPDRADAVFGELYAHFSSLSAWKIMEGAAGAIAALAGWGLVLGFASNFDHRLHAIADGLPGLSPLRHRIISSEVGWLKPSPRFFEAVIRAADCAPDRIVFVGDNRINDFTGANAAGMRGVLFDPGPLDLPGLRRIRRLTELLE
jgi:putative hydrolase of the HAD superfamily